MKTILFVMLLFACSSSPAERAPTLAPASTPTSAPAAAPSPPEIKALAKLHIPDIIAGTKFSDTLMKVSPDGSKLLYLNIGFEGDDGAPHLLSLPGGEPVNLEQPPTFDIHETRFSDDGRQLLLIGETKDSKTFLLVVDAVTGKVIKRLPLSAGVRHEIVDQDRIIALGLKGESFSFVNTKTGAKVKNKSQNELVLREGRLLSRALFSSSFFNTPPLNSPIEIFDVGTGELLFSVGPFPDWTRRTALSSDNTRLMLCQGLDTSRSDRIYDPEWTSLHVSVWDQRGQHKILERSDWISADLHPSGEQLVVLTDKGEAFVWGLSQEKKLASMNAKDAQDIFYAAGGDTIWIEDSAGSLTLWDAKTGSLRQEAISTISHKLVAQGELLLTKDKLQVYKVWSARTGDLLLDLGPNTVTFDRGFFLAASNEMVYVWKIPEELMPKRPAQ